MPDGTYMLEIDHVTKRFGDLVAVDDLSLRVPRGIVFGLLGPNGAGKTTTLEMAEGLQRPDGGAIRVDGIPVTGSGSAVKDRIGIQLQATSFFDLLTVRETIALFASLYPRSQPVPPLLQRLDLEDKADGRVRTLSGGQRQRLAVALALVHDPALVFLDEPTAGLDPQARRALWDVVAETRREGRTVVITTHYMDEAEILCDELAIMDHGKVLAEGPPAQLIRSELPAVVIEVGHLNLPPGGFPAVDSVEAVVDGWRLMTSNLDRALVELVEWAGSSGQALMDVRTRTATLEDVFLKLTGRALRE
jgi:ABC-2 type transport system ATP-binding protein